MRRRGLYLAIAGAFSVAGLVLAAAAPSPPRFADRSPSAIPVDVELVIAVDVSYSMDPDEQALQREGYTQALQRLLVRVHRVGHVDRDHQLNVDRDGARTSVGKARRTWRSGRKDKTCDAECAGDG